MNKIKIALVIIVSLILQTTIFSRINVFSTNTNIYIPIIVGLSLGFGPYIGGYSGLIIGLIEDILFSNILGIRALIYFVIGFIIGNSQAGINKEDMRAGLFLTSISTMINFILNEIITVMVGGKINFINYLTGPIFVETILNSIIYIFIFLFFKKIFVFPRFRL